nr:MULTISPECIES: alkaline phosphatase PhoX [unclassified Paenibacillus]
MNKGTYRSFQNNGLYVIPVSSRSKDPMFPFASAPVEAALSGPAFTPNEQTLFLSVRHPGEASQGSSQPTSKWPHRSGDRIPRSALVAVTRPIL